MTFYDAVLCQTRHESGRGGMIASLSSEDESEGMKGRAMSDKMLKFVNTDKEMPEKRGAGDRVGDFDEIYNEFDVTSAETQASRCSQCGVRSARSTARFTTTSPTG